MTGPRPPDLGPDAGSSAELDEDASAQAGAIDRLHPLLAGVVFSHLVNGDDMSIVGGNVAVEYGPNQPNADGPAVDLTGVDPDAVLSARFNGEPVDAGVLAALARRALHVRAGDAQ